MIFTWAINGASEGSTIEKPTELMKLINIIRATSRLWVCRLSSSEILWGSNFSASDIPQTETAMWCCRVRTENAPEYCTTRIRNQQKVDVTPENSDVDSQQPSDTHPSTAINRLYSPYEVLGYFCLYLYYSILHMRIFFPGLIFRLTLSLQYQMKTLSWKKKRGEFIIFLYFSALLLAYYAWLLSPRFGRKWFYHGGMPMEISLDGFMLFSLIFLLQFLCIVTAKRSLHDPETCLKDGFAL